MNNCFKVSLLLSISIIVFAYDCALYENDPMGAYLRVRDIDSFLPRNYESVIDRNYYRKVSLTQPCLQTDSSVKIPVVGSLSVEDKVISGASSILSMLNASSIFMRRLMAENVYVAIVPAGRNPCHLPETRNVFCDPNWGGVNLKRDQSLVVIVRTESLLCQKLNNISQHGGILIHELTHAIEFVNRLQSRTYSSYLRAYEKNLWKGTYIDKGPNEYLPVGAEIYFEFPLNIAYEWPVRTRSQLKEYDPSLYSILREIFGDTPLIDGQHICTYKCD